jgi:hypothetical protein
LQLAELFYPANGVRAIHERVDRRARKSAPTPHDFKLILAAGGQRASGIEQLEGAAGPSGS